MSSAATASVLLLAALLRWHYDRWQRLLASKDRHSAPSCVGILLHVRMERLRLACVYFQVANATYGAVGP